MTKLDVLFDSLAETEKRRATDAEALELDIKLTLNAEYKDWTALQAAIDALESGNCMGYVFDEQGEVCSWIRFEAFSDVPTRERQYLESYVEDQHFLRVDFAENALIQNLGGDEIVIQAYLGQDSGIYQCGKLIVSPSEYYADGSVDITERNRLIEAHMERTGCFPGVFEVSYYGDITPVNTSEET